MTELETLREQLRRQQKLASLGMLSAGIAHEIQNPLNFVINFSKMSERILADMRDILDDIEDVMDKAPQDVAERLGDTAENIAELNDIADDLTTNMQKIREHGERAVSIIQGILLISRGKEGEPTWRISYTNTSGSPTMPSAPTTNRSISPYARTIRTPCRR